MNKLRTYVQEAYLELMQKVSWPSWNELQSSGTVVLITIVIITLIIFIMDFAFREVLQSLIYPALVR